MKLFSKGWAGAFVLTAGLLFSGAADARSLGFKVGATTVEEVTTTVCTTAKGQSVDMFGNGADMDMVWALQRELGSKGSGAWETVQGYSDVFPTASTSTVQVSRYESQKPGTTCFRLKVTTDGGGTGHAQIVTDGNAPTADPGRATHNIWFDDFGRSVLAVAALGSNPGDYLCFVGDGSGSSVVGVGEVSPEGILTLTGGDDGDAEDTSECTLGAAGNVSLTSVGLHIFEVRSSVEDITAGDWFVGLSEDVSANNSEDPEHDIDSNTITDNAAVNSGVSIGMSSDADNATLLHAVSTNATAIGNAAGEYSLGNAPVAATYQVLRIEIPSTGDAFFYVDGVLMGAEPLAVATTSTLMPYFVATSADDCTASCGVTKLDIDYLLWITPRPTGT